jgi:hypothetical protein
MLESSLSHVGTATSGAFDMIVREIGEKFVYVDPSSGTRRRGDKLKLKLIANAECRMSIARGRIDQRQFGWHKYERQS